MAYGVMEVPCLAILHLELGQTCVAQGLLTFVGAIGIWVGSLGVIPHKRKLGTDGSESLLQSYKKWLAAGILRCSIFLT